jgi:MFS family permease
MATNMIKPNSKPNTNQQAPHAGLMPTPLIAVLIFTFVGSLGTGAITNGFSFIATQGLGYERKMNLLLALVLGASYIAGALLSGKLVKSARYTPRTLLAILLVLIAIICQLPMLAKLFAPHHLQRQYLEYAVWLLIIVFSPATGVFWPIVEGYLSGGRQGKDLRSSIGRFNIVWSAALVISFWLMAPLLKDHPFLILSLLGLCQLALIIVLRWFPTHPPKHLPIQPETATIQTSDQPNTNNQPVPEVYAQLLILFRVLLIASYIVLSALSPLLPIVEAELGVDVQWKTPLASAWLISRLFLFIFFERWHGWHGRWWTPWTGMACMLVGFAGAVGSPIIQSATGSFAAGIAMLIFGLVIVGIGIAMTYYGALYYAMAIGNTQTHPNADTDSDTNHQADASVEAGGKHEAVIGLGYTIGPLCGILALQSAQSPTGPSDDAFRFTLIALVSGAVLIATVLGIVLIRRSKLNQANSGSIAQAIEPPFDPPSPH